MIDGLALDFSAARIAARLAWRPDERLWQRLHAARDLAALLDTARSAPVGNYLSGLPARAGCDEVDAALRAQWRARVAELAGWVPAAWRAAVQWTAHLVDLTALAHLWTQPPLPWMLDDPVLMRYAAPRQAAAVGCALLITGPMAPLGRALAAGAKPNRSGAQSAALAHRQTRHGAGRVPAGDEQAPLPVALAAWITHWTTLWPSTVCDGAEHAALHALIDDVLAHRRRFANLPLGDTSGARAALAHRVLARRRTDPAAPVALFAYLVMLAVDLERLRAECHALAFDADRAARGSLQ